MRTYFEISCLLTLVAATICFLTLFVRKGWLESRFAGLLRNAQILLLIAILAPLLALALPKRTLLMSHSEQVWSGLSAIDSRLSLKSPAAAKIQAMALAPTTPLVPSVFELIAAGAVLAFALLAFRFFRLRRFLEKTPLIRQIGRVKVVATEEGTPFSARLGRTAWIALPLEICARRDDLAIALRHEFQHHRNGDLVWVFVLEFLKVLFFWNPAVYWLSRTMAELQEFACDESLIGRQKFSPQAYSGCLVRAAENLVRSRIVWVGTASMAVREPFLKRRIEMIVKKRSSTRYSKRMAVAVLGTVALMSSLTYISRCSAEESSPLSLTEAKKYAEIAARSSDIPLDMNDLVLARLNYQVGTAEGRESFKASLARMKRYESMILQKAERYGIPAEIIGVALSESGFKNDVVSPHARAAGIWQFIPETARRFGLEVSDTLDERFNPEKETDAAMKLLKALYSQFGDWRLALKGYNEGEVRVQSLIDKYGTRDAWTLERLDTRENYISGPIAIMILLKNPSLIP